MERLVAAGATALVSFGLAGGLDPKLRPGTLIVPVGLLIPDGFAASAPSPLAASPLAPSPADRAIADTNAIPTDPALTARLGGPTPHIMLGGDTIVTLAAEKRRLFQATGAAAIDLESGAVARAAISHNLPFAILRVICDPAERDLPPAALTALNNQGAIGLLRVIGSLLANPRQFPALMTLAADAAAARQALAARVAAIGQLSISA